MTYIPTFPDFIDFHDVDYETYAAYVDKYEPYSDFNYVSLYSWDTDNACRLSLHNDNLVLSFKDYLQDTWVLSVLGDSDIGGTSRALLEFAKNNDVYSNKLVCVPETVAKQLISDQNLHVDEDPDNHDYILSAKKYMMLEGKEFANKRKNINKFEKLYGDRTVVKIVDLSDDFVLNEIKKLAYEWAFMGTEGSINAQNELSAISRILNAATCLSEKLKIECLAIYIDGKMEGFCIYEVHDDYAITHFGKANVIYNKAYEFLMVQTLRYIYSEHGVDYVNNEQDLGIEGLRQSKRNQQPIGYYKKYTVAASELA
ncbi:MAG TPA: phosphatidylglycerol lysyltransferase domain-containing protein [Candidatus Saccharimonadales bacterium]|jgi:hypothetical protein